MEDKMKTKEFKKRYNDYSISISQGIELVNKLSKSQKEELLKGLNVVDEYCGLTMRAEWLKRALATSLDVERRSKNSMR